MMWIDGTDQLKQSVRTYPFEEDVTKDEVMKGNRKSDIAKLFISFIFAEIAHSLEVGWSHKLVSRQFQFTNSLTLLLGSVNDGG